MKFEDLQKLYLRKQKQFGASTYKHISEILADAKKIHKKDWRKKPTKQKDHEQSWRAFKGKNLEKLVEFIITREVEEIGLKVANGNALERIINSASDLWQVKRNLVVDYGEWGLHLPDVDLVIYRPRTYQILAVISSKVTLRERIAQTGYWKLKFVQDEMKRHIKVFFFTPDEDRTLSVKMPTKKGRAIAEVELDGSYVLTNEIIEESEKVKLFENFIDDLKRLT